MIIKKETDSGTYFLLDSENICCVLRVRGGKLEQIHMGGRILPGDIEALSYRDSLGWGCSTLYEDNFCLDSVPLAWSGSSSGDYRESPVELSCPTDFVFSDAVIKSDGAPEKSDSSLPHAHGKCEKLEILMTSGKLSILLIFRLFDTALVRSSILTNSGSRPVFVNRLMSMMADLPGEYDLTSFHGGWIAEMHGQTAPVSRTRTVNDSMTGFSSNRNNPGVVLSKSGASEDSGSVFGLNIIYSGNHYTSAQRSQQGYTRIMQGISPECFSSELRPGCSFETPESVIVWSGKGYNGMSRNMHRFVNEHIVPENWKYRSRPVLYNSWEGCMFSFTEAKLLSLAKKAKKLGCELFVLDDGWFGDRNNDAAGLGDYRVNSKKLPGGISGLARKIHGMGMQFGLWFEPEAVNPDSDLYRAHPDWALHDEIGRDLYGRNELLLDLRKPEVRDYIAENVSGIIDRAGIDYVKWDMNRQSPLKGNDAHEYILGLYDLLGRIFGPRENVLLESCSSGGNRFDLGMLCFSPQIWASDNTDPVERLEIQNGLSYLYPQSAVGAHISASPHAQTLRLTPLSTRENVSFFGILGLELELSHLLPVEESELKAAIELYKKHRRIFQFGTFIRQPCAPGAFVWELLADSKADAEEKSAAAVAGIFHTLQHASPESERLVLSELEQERIYSVSSRKQSLRVGQFGALVKYISPIGINPNGAVIRTADRHYRMEDVSESYSCSGYALMSGVPLPQHFTGTGYSKDMRSQGDFNSNVYIIE